MIKRRARVTFCSKTKTLLRAMFKTSLQAILLNESIYAKQIHTRASTCEVKFMHTSLFNKGLLHVQFLLSHVGLRKGEPMVSFLVGDTVISFVLCHKKSPTVGVENGPP